MDNSNASHNYRSNKPWQDYSASKCSNPKGVLNSPSLQSLCPYSDFQKATDTTPSATPPVCMTDSLATSSRLRQPWVLQEYTSERSPHHLQQEYTSERSPHHLQQEYTSERSPHHLQQEYTSEPYPHSLQQEYTSEPSGHLLQQEHISEPSADLLQQEHISEPSAHLLQQGYISEPSSHHLRQEYISETSSHRLQQEYISEPSPHFLQQGYTSEPSPHHSNGMFNGPSPEFSSCSNIQTAWGGNTQPHGDISNPSSESRYGLDPQHLPSAVQVMAEDRAEWEGKVFVSEPDSPLPPLATTDCLVEDRGNASPKFIRCTSYSFPNEGQAAQQSHLPLGAIVTPLACLGDGERPLPVCVRDGERGLVPLCGACGAHMCPFMAWQDCGQRFFCPFCGQLTEVPWHYYQPTDTQGQRVDREHRPELSLGSYDILETQTGQAPGLLLAVDVSGPAVRGGHLDLICHQLRAFLASLLREEGADLSDLHVGLMTYDRRLHLFDLSPALSRPHMLVVTETQEFELPLCNGLLVPLRDCRDCIDSVLEQIPGLAAESEDTPGSQELPFRAGLKILQAVGRPGKLLVFHSAPLTEGTLKHSSSGFFSSSRPKSLFQPTESCISLAKQCISQGFCIQLFLFSKQDAGGSWPGAAPYLTGGGVFSYDCLKSEVNRKQFRLDLRRCVGTDTGYKAKLKIFVSKGLHVTGCYGAFPPGPDPSHISMAALDWRTALAIQFTHRSPLEEKRGVFIQAVLSYTNLQGEKRTRVHNLSLRCSRHLLDTFRNCQAQTLLTFYCKKMYCAVLERPLQELREELQTEVTEALACYRKHCCSSAVTPGQLVLPQFLKALPVYVNSLRKSEVLLPGVHSSVPQRLHLHSQLLGMDTRTTALYFYPLLVRLPVCGPPESSFSAIEALRCCASNMDPAGLYLAYCPLTLLLWVGSCALPSALLQLFNVTCFSELPSGEVCLPVLENTLSIRVRKLIDTLQSNSHHSLALKVVKQGEGSEESLQHLLVEDKSPNGGASYADFLYHLHVNTLRLML